jgi:hypothetical protein
MQVRSIVCIVTSVQPRVILNGNNIVKLMTSIDVGNSIPSWIMST